MSKLEKRTETIEGKRPWESGFQAEEQKQKSERRKENGQDENLIKTERLTADQIKRTSK